MSTKIKVQRICEHCGEEFTAKTTVTRFCSHKCSQRAYKHRKRQEKIETSNQQTRMIISKPIEELDSKVFLSVRDASNLFSISERTIYRMISRGDIGVAKAGSRTILRRSDFNDLFAKDYPKRVIAKSKPTTEFYTVKDVEEIYFVKYVRLNRIIKENKIPTKMVNGRLHVSKSHIDKYFSRTRQNVSHISDWYSVAEIQEKYSLTREQVYSRTHDNNIPKQRVGNSVRISKKHFDELYKPSTNNN